LYLFAAHEKKLPAVFEYYTGEIVRGKTKIIYLAVIGEKEERVYTSKERFKDKILWQTLDIVAREEAFLKAEDILDSLEKNIENLPKNKVDTLLNLRSDPALISWLTKPKSYFADVYKYEVVKRLDSYKYILKWAVYDKNKNLIWRSNGFKKSPIEFELEELPVSVTPERFTAKIEKDNKVIGYIQGFWDIWKFPDLPYAGNLGNGMYGFIINAENKIISPEFTPLKFRKYTLESGSVFTGPLAGRDYPYRFLSRQLKDVHVLLVYPAVSAGFYFFRVFLYIFSFISIILCLHYIKKLRVWLTVKKPFSKKTWLEDGLKEAIELNQKTIELVGKSQDLSHSMKQRELFALGMLTEKLNRPPKEIPVKNIDDQKRSEHLLADAIMNKEKSEKSEESQEYGNTTSLTEAIKKISTEKSSVAKVITGFVEPEEKIRVTVEPEKKKIEKKKKRNQKEEIVSEVFVSAGYREDDAVEIIEPARPVIDLKEVQTESASAKKIKPPIDEKFSEKEVAIKKEPVVEIIEETKETKETEEIEKKDEINNEKEFKKESKKAEIEAKPTKDPLLEISLSKLWPDEKFTVQEVSDEINNLSEITNEKYLEIEKELKKKPLEIPLANLFPKDDESEVKEIIDELSENEESQEEEIKSAVIEAGIEKEEIRLPQSEANDLIEIKDIDSGDEIVPLEFFESEESGSQAKEEESSENILEITEKKEIKTEPKNKNFVFFAEEDLEKKILKFDKTKEKSKEEKSLKTSKAKIEPAKILCVDEVEDELFQKPNEETKLSNIPDIKIVEIEEQDEPVIESKEVETPEESAVTSTEDDTPEDLASASPQIETPEEVAVALPEAETPEEVAVALPEVETPEESVVALAEVETPEESAAASSQVETPEEVAVALAEVETPEESAAASSQVETPEEAAVASTEAETPEEVAVALPEVETPEESTVALTEVETTEESAIALPEAETPEEVTVASEKIVKESLKEFGTKKNVKYDKYSLRGIEKAEDAELESEDINGISVFKKKDKYYREKYYTTREEILPLVLVDEEDNLKKAG